MAENVVNTYNVFVDSSRGHSANSKGDDFELNLGHTNVVADEGQYIRLSLNNFSMHKTFTDINDSNNTFKLQCITSSGASEIDRTIAKKNYTTLNALANAFADAVGNGIVAQTSAASFTKSEITPNSTTSVGGDSDYIISFKLTFNTNHNLTATPKIWFVLNTSDSFEILGGDRVENYDVATSLSSVSVSKTVDTVTVTCLYPAQRQTIDHVYLRAVGTQNTSVETLGFLNPNETHKADVTDSDILAKIPVDVEYCSYEAQTGREYFLNIRQKVLTNLRFRLTDRHNRPIGRVFNSASNTASGTGSNQSTLGNLSFNAVIRVDIIQQRHPRHLETTGIPERTAARFENLLIQPKFGKSDY